MMSVSSLKLSAIAALFTLAMAQSPSASLAGNALGSVVAAAPQGETQAKDDARPNLSPEEKMNRRFPQPVRVGDLMGLPVLDYQDSTIGYVRQVVRTPAGKIQLVVPYGRWFGWVKFDGPFGLVRRPVGVAIETVAILGRQLNALDMSREEFDSAPKFEIRQNKPIPPDDVIKIAIGRR
jgi:hypothetical protein